MENIIIIAVILLIVGAAGYYIYRAKKNGQHCIGCSCSGKCGSCGNCKNSGGENKSAS